MTDAIDHPKDAPAPAPMPQDAAGECGHGAEGLQPIYNQGSWSRENSFGYLMRRIMQIMVAQADKRLEDHGLTQAQWTPLFMIQKGKCTTLAELSRELQLDAGALTRTLDRLEAKGLCKRVRSSEDRRVVHLALTPEGEAALAPVPGVLCEVSNSLLEGFTQQEWEALMGFLRRLMTNAQALRDATDNERQG